MAERLISEVLNKAGELKTKKEKVVYLSANNSRPLRSVLKGSFDNTVQFNLPEGIPPYRKDDAPKGFEISNLHRICRRFKYFNKGGVGDGMSSTRREKMFIDCLESLHPDEAEVMLAMKNKKLDKLYPGISATLVSEIWPNLLVEIKKPTRAKKKVVKKTKKVAVNPKI